MDFPAYVNIPATPVMEHLPYMNIKTSEVRYIAKHLDKQLR
jgi:hypothetical protein